MSDTIARIETFQVVPRWLLVRIETSDGVVGWGRRPVRDGRRLSSAPSSSSLNC